MARGDANWSVEGYTHQHSTIGNNKVVYNVKTTGDRWFPTAYDNAFNTNTGHNDKLNDYGVEDVVTVANACPGSPGC